MCAEAQLEEMRAALVGLVEAAQLGKADALNSRCAQLCALHPLHAKAHVTSGSVLYLYLSRGPHLT